MFSCPGVVFLKEKRIFIAKSKSKVMKKSLFFCVFLYGIGVMLMSCSNELEVQEKVKALPILFGN